MPTPWLKAIRDSHQLTVFATAAVTQGPWNSVLTNALQEFNRISSKMQLGITFTRSALPPDPSSMLSGANVQFHAADGTVREDVLKNRFGDVLFSFTKNISGTALLGHTEPPAWKDDKGVETQFRAYIYVPKTPMINAGPTGQQKSRGAGDGVKLFMAVHELIHACGLSNREHSLEKDADVYVAQPQTAVGATPQEDKLRVRLEPLLLLPFDPPAPPLFLTERTAGLIRSIWR